MTKHCNDAKMKAHAALEAAQAALVDLRNKEAEANAVLAAVEKQKADAEKKRADMVLFEISGATGLVCRCHIPTAAVAQRGLFRILLGSGAPSTVSNVQQKSHWAPSGDWAMGSPVLPTDDLSGNYLNATVTTTIKVSTDVA
jgi:hypothetical protein